MEPQPPIEEYNRLLTKSWREFSRLPRLPDQLVSRHEHRAYIWTIYGQLDRVMELDVEELDRPAPSGDLLVHAAIQFDRIELLEYLDEHHICHDRPTSRKGLSCLYLSVSAMPDNLNMFRWLINHEFRIDNNLIYVVVDVGRLEMFQLIPRALLLNFSWVGYDIYHHLINFKRPEMFQWLCTESAPDFERSRSSSGMNLLIHAAIRSKEIFDWLREQHRWDLNYITPCRQGVLYYMARSTSPDFSFSIADLRAIIADGADPRRNQLIQGLSCRVELEPEGFELLKSLIRRYGFHSEIALDLADHGSLTADYLRQLIDLGVDWTVRRRYNQQDIGFAVCRWTDDPHLVPLLRMLKRLGWNPDQVDSNGETPFDHLTPDERVQAREIFQIR